MSDSEQVIIKQTPTRERFNRLSLTRASGAMINMQKARKEKRVSEESCQKNIEDIYNNLTKTTKSEKDDKEKISSFINGIKNEELLGLKMEDYVFLLKHPNACKVVELIMRNSRGVTQLKDAVIFCKSLDEHENEKLIMVHDDAASFTIPFCNYKVRMRDILILNLFWDLFCDSAPTMEQIRSTVETVGLLGALSLSVAIGFPTAFDYEELLAAKIRFADCDEDVVDAFGVSTYRCFLFNAASVGSSIIIIFVSCATDLDDPIKLRKWWMWVRFCVIIAMGQCFLGSFFGFGCFWMMIRLKWPANKPNESYMAGECDAPPPLLDTTEVWMGNYWFSKILIYCTFLLVGGMMSMSIMRDYETSEKITKVQPKNNVGNTNQSSSNSSISTDDSATYTPSVSKNNSDSAIDVEHGGVDMRTPEPVQKKM